MDIFNETGIINAQIIEFAVIGVFVFALFMAVAFNFKSKLSTNRLLEQLEDESKDAGATFLSDVCCVVDSLNIDQVVLSPYGTAIKYKRGDEFEVLEKIFIDGKIYNVGDIVTINKLGFVFTNIPSNLYKQEIQVQKNIHC